MTKAVAQSTRVEKLRLDLGVLRKRIATRAPYLFTQAAPTLTRLVSNLQTGEYELVSLHRVDWGPEAGGRYSIDIAYQEVTVAKVDVYRAQVRWFDYSLHLHIYIMNVLGQAVKAKRLAKEAVMEKQRQAAIAEFLAESSERTAVVDSCPPWSTQQH